MKKKKELLESKIKLQDCEQHRYWEGRICKLNYLRYK